MIASTTAIHAFSSAAATSVAVSIAANTGRSKREIFIIKGGTPLTGANSCYITLAHAGTVVDAMACFPPGMGVTNYDPPFVVAASGATVLTISASGNANTFVSIHYRDI